MMQVCEAMIEWIMMNVCSKGVFLSHLKLNILLIILYAVFGVQGKAFPSKYKRSLEGSYRYIPYKEIAQLPAGYSSQSLPKFEDYIHGYAQTNGNDWAAYYHPLPSKAVQYPYSNVNGHDKMKEKRTWHFIDQNHVPLTQYRDVGYPFESHVEAPNVIESFAKEDVDGHYAEYESPVIVEALAREDNTHHLDAEIPVIVDKEVYGYKQKMSNKPMPLAFYDDNESSKTDTFGTLKLSEEAISQIKKDKQEHSYDTDEALNQKPINAHSISSNEFERPDSINFLNKKDKPVDTKPVVSQSAFELPVVVDSLIKKDKPNKDKPVKGKPIKDKSVQVKPVNDKPIVTYNTIDHPVGLSTLGKVNQDQETPVVIEALVRKETPMFHMNDEYDLPVVVEALVRKDLAYENKETNSKENIQDLFHSEKVSITKEDLQNDIPVVEVLALENIVSNESQQKEGFSFDEKFDLTESEIDSLDETGKLVKDKPVNDKLIATYNKFDHPVGLGKVSQDHETPVVIEALVRKTPPKFHMNDEYDLPVVVEALVRKDNDYENKETNPKENIQDLFHSEKVSITKEDVLNFGIPVVEVLALKNIASTEIPQEEVFSFEGKFDLTEPEIDSLDEVGDIGSAMDFDGSRFGRSFLPENSNMCSMKTNIEDEDKQRQKFKNCVTLKKESGNCMPFQQCSVLSAVSNIEELLRNVCIIDEIFIGVCCPEFPVETVRVDWEQLKPDTEIMNEEKPEISKECGRLQSMSTERDPWPWMAFLIARSSGKIFCGGALIAEQYILTAAHCTKRIPRNQILVRLGRATSENGHEPDFEVIEIKRHAGYNPRTMQNDIALLKLSRRVQFKDFRHAICLANDEEGIEGLVSESASLLRWKESPGEIEDVEHLSVISNKECQNRMRTVIAESILCTEPRTDETMCNADSGAPLIIAKDEKFEVIGILTWNRNDCDERFPTVFTRVSSYRRWIKNLAS